MATALIPAHFLLRPAWDADRICHCFPSHGKLYIFSVWKYNARSKEGEILSGVQFCISVLGTLVHTHAHTHTETETERERLMQRSWWRALNNTNLCRWHSITELLFVLNRHGGVLESATGFWAKSSEFWILFSASQQILLHLPGSSLSTCSAGLRNCTWSEEVYKASERPKPHL